MRRLPALAVLLATLALQGCGVFSITDRYGNTYGGFYDYGNRYQWQLGVCDKEIASSPIHESLKKRAMQCCMWRHGVPIEDSRGCEAPPYNGEAGSGKPAAREGRAT